MARYFFDTYDGDRFILDDDGLEVPDLAAAKAEARRALPDFARDALPDSDQRTFVIRVRDETGQVVIRASLTLIVETALETATE